jgi:hypothetical protein
MADKTLVDAVKAIVANARAGNLDDAYSGYRKLFSSPKFSKYEPNDQRQALRLMIHAKGVPSPPSKPMLAAHRVAIAPLTALVAQHGEPGDHEMLGMCHVVTGDEQSAAAIFRAGLAIERERNAQSDLCGTLMKRVSML